MNTSLITQVSLLRGKLHNISSQFEQCVILMLTKEKTAIITPIATLYFGYFLVTHSNI